MCCQTEKLTRSEKRLFFSSVVGNDPHRISTWNETLDTVATSSLLFQLTISVNQYLIMELIKFGKGFKTSMEGLDFN